MNADNVDTAVLIMARAPRPGAVKTRLQPMLGPTGCARLQAALIRHTLLLARRVAPTGSYLALDPPEAVAEMAGLIPAGMPILPQRGADLGARMASAIEDVASLHYGPIIVIGTDAPTLTAGHLRTAAGQIIAGADAVLGPALDGGYYLIALRGSASELLSIDPELWGGPDVFRATVDAAADAGLRVELLSPLRDLDTPSDALAFLADPDLPADIAELLTVANPAG